MRTFFGGQIKKEFRGGLSAVITEGECAKKIYTFLYPTNSEEFVYLTGARSVNYASYRVYIGISQDAGEAITRITNEKKFDENDLRRIDEMVVIPHFLNTNLEKPSRIVLESTLNGYQVAKEE